MRAETHRIDVEGCRAGGRDDLAAELERAAGDYARAADRFESRGGDVLGALAGHAAWTSSATPRRAAAAGHGRRRASAAERRHRRPSPRAPARRGAAASGSPSGAHAPWLDPLLEEAGVHATCRGPDRRARPRRRAPPAADRQRGGPAARARRPGRHGPRVERRRLPRARRLPGLPPPHHPRPPPVGQRRLGLRRRPSVGAGARGCGRLRCPCRAAGGRRRAERVARSTPSCSATGGTRASPGSRPWSTRRGAKAWRWWGSTTALADAAPAPPPSPHRGVTTWGTRRDLSTWSAPRVADLAFAARDAELRVVAAGARAGERAVRELLALQSSDWAFMVSRDLAEPYGRERAAAHAARSTPRCEHRERAIRTCGASRRSRARPRCWPPDRRAGGRSVRDSLMIPRRRTYPSRVPAAPAEGNGGPMGPS